MMSQRRVVISGMGVISPLSLTLEGFWERLVSGEGAVRPFHQSDDRPAPVAVAAPALFDGQIDDFGSTDMTQKKAIKKAQKVMSREIQMAVAASCRTLADAKIQIGQFPAERTGISFGSDYIITTVEDVLDGMRTCYRNSGEKHPFDFPRWAPEGLPKMPPLWQLKYLPNMPASHIAILNQFHGPSNSITLREASIGASIGESVAIIASGRTDMMLVGTTGSRLHPFKMIHAMQQEELTDTACRPFDRDRDGTVPGEGAGALLLEEREHAEKRGARIYAEVVAASYRIRHSRSGKDLRREAVIDALRDVLRRGMVEPEQIGHLNAHGLGSRDADRAEASAIAEVFGKRQTPIPVTALKGFFGNLGAGAGTIELIGGVLALENKTLFSSLGYSTPDPECPVSIAAAGDAPGDSFVKISFSPQGQASAVLIRRLSRDG